MAVHRRYLNPILAIGPETLVCSPSPEKSTLALCSRYTSTFTSTFTISPTSSISHHLVSGIPTGGKHLEKGEAFGNEIKPPGPFESLLR